MVAVSTFTKCQIVTLVTVTVGSQLAPSAAVRTVDVIVRIYLQVG